MAIVKPGSMLDGLRGRVGDLVFREVGGRTVVSRRPSGRREDVRSADRQRALSRFQEAVRFAREARSRPAYRSLSRVLRAHSPYHVALQDYLSLPVIEGVDASGVGPSGGQLMLHVSERIAVRSVRVKMGGRPAATREPQTAQEPAPGPESHPEPTPAPRADTAGPSAQAGPPRYQVPAAVFFRRVSRPEPRPEQPAVLPLEPSAVSAEPPAPGGSPAPPATESAGPVDLHATRRLGIQTRSDRTAATEEGARVEVWQVVLPRAGEIEVIAVDYAGNHARRLFKVGLPGGELD